MGFGRSRVGGIGAVASRRVDGRDLGANGDMVRMRALVLRALGLLLLGEEVAPLVARQSRHDEVGSHYSERVVAVGSVVASAEAGWPGVVEVCVKRRRVAEVRRRAVSYVTDSD